jgi:glycosyltransferase involved in cell wall biosynthesis
MSPADRNNFTPIDISVVVPARDEANSIRALIEGLLAQTYPPREIIITDGGSKDATVAIIEEFIQAGAPVRLFREQQSLPGHARNVGVQNARCDWIAFTDAGTTPAPDWLESLVRKVEAEPNVDVVYGTFQPITDRFFTECAVITYLPPPVTMEGAFVQPRSIASALMKRVAWETAGGFPEDLRSAEDLVFMQRVQDRGFHELRAPAALVYWSIQPNHWRTFKRFVTYARNNIRAGLWRRWQAAIFLRYFLLVMLALPAIFLGLKWLIVPLAGWLGLMLARAANAVRRNRVVYPAGPARNLFRVFLIVTILAVIDLAAFVGSFNWLLLDKLGLAGKSR